MNADANDDRTGNRTDDEQDPRERMRELGRRSGEARRRKREERERALLEPQTDRDRALAALRRALDSANTAAATAAAKTLLELDRVERREQRILDERAAPIEHRGVSIRDIFLVAREAGVVDDDLLRELRAIEPGAPAAVTDDGNSDAGRAIAQRELDATSNGSEPMPPAAT
jgi:hypothetical protein